jgi:hypothetical protein
VKFTNAEGEIVAEMTVRKMVKMLAEHLIEHIETVEKVIMETN